MPLGRTEKEGEAVVRTGSRAPFPGSKFLAGRIDLVPQDGVYVAKSHILPLVLLTPQTTSPQPVEGPGRVLSVGGCAGQI